MPLLMTATLVEAPHLQQLALSIIGDVAFALARVPAGEELQEAVEQLGGAVRLLSACMYAPDIELQYIAAFALARLVVGAHATWAPGDSRDRGGYDSEDSTSEDGGDPANCGDGPSGARERVLDTCIDMESLIADLAYRYTAEPLEGVASKAAIAAQKALMAMLLACFEALVEGDRNADLSNTVVWVLLGAAEEGVLDDLRDCNHAEAPAAMGRGHTAAHADALLEARTLRCARFLTGLILSKPGLAAERQRQIVDSLISAAQINLNLEHSIDVPLGVLVEWLGVGRYI